MFNIFKKNNKTTTYVVTVRNLCTEEVETFMFVNDPIGFNSFCDFCVNAYIDYRIISIGKI